MPRGDGTGPAAVGSMTGRAAGYCAGYAVPGYANPSPGRGLGFGRGRGFGFGRGMGQGFRGSRGWGGYQPAPGAAPVHPWAAVLPYGAPAGGGAPAPEQESELLKGQVEFFEQALKDARKRIAGLEAAAAEQK